MGSKSFPFYPICTSDLLAKLQHIRTVVEATSAVANDSFASIQDVSARLSENGAPEESFPGDSAPKASLGHELQNQRFDPAGSIDVDSHRKASGWKSSWSSPRSIAIQRRQWLVAESADGYTGVTTLGR